MYWKKYNLLRPNKNNEFKKERLSKYCMNYRVQYQGQGTFKRITLWVKPSKDFLDRRSLRGTRFGEKPRKNRVLPNKISWLGSLLIKNWLFSRFKFCMHSPMPINPASYEKPVASSLWVYIGSLNTFHWYQITLPYLPSLIMGLSCFSF